MTNKRKRIYRYIAIVLCVHLLCQNIVVNAEEYEYDDLNRVTKVIYDDGSYVEYTYDANGNIVKTKVCDINEEESSSGNTSEVETETQGNSSDIEDDNKSGLTEEEIALITEFFKWQDKALRIVLQKLWDYTIEIPLRILDHLNIIDLGKWQ